MRWVRRRLVHGWMSLQEAAESLARDKQRLNHAPLSVSGAWQIDGAPFGRVSSSPATSNAVQTLDASGAVIGSQPEEDVSRRVAVVWKEGAWLLLGITFCWLHSSP